MSYRNVAVVMFSTELGDARHVVKSGRLVRPPDGEPGDDVARVFGTTGAVRCDLVVGAARRPELALRVAAARGETRAMKDAVSLAVAWACNRSRAACLTCASDPANRFHNGLATGKHTSAGRPRSLVSSKSLVAHSFLMTYRQAW